MTSLTSQTYFEPSNPSYNHLDAVSTSMPENPNALSPSMATTGARWASGRLCSTRAAATANPQPTPMVPNVPASSLSDDDDGGGG